jgi:hypothetical protein
MEVLTTTQLAIPTMQVVLLLALSTGALLIGRLKLALLINYCFTLYWGYVASLNLFSTEGVMQLNNYTFLYFGFGLAIVVLALIGFFTYRE